MKVGYSCPGITTDTSQCCRKNEIKINIFKLILVEFADSTYTLDGGKLLPGRRALIAPGAVIYGKKERRTLLVAEEMLEDSHDEEHGY